MTLETQDDRTLFFDMLPLTFRAEKAVSPSASSSSRCRGRSFTAPPGGSSCRGPTASRSSPTPSSPRPRTTRRRFIDLRENLKANGLTLDQMPLVIQFNKRDLPAVRSDAELVDLARRGKEPVFPAVAIAGKGVLETFFGLLHLTYSSLDAEHKLAEKFGIGGRALSRRRGAEARLQGAGRSAASFVHGWGARCARSRHEWLVIDDDASVPVDHHLEGLTARQRLRLQDLANRDALRELVRSFHSLFGIPLRIFSADGSLLAESVPSSRSAAM